MLFVLVWFASGGVANNVDVGFAFVLRGCLCCADVFGFLVWYFGFALW